MSRYFSPAIKRQAWDRCGGRCEYVRDGERCNAALTPGNRIYDHADAHTISHNSSLANCQVICADCNRHKTALDAGRIAKTRGMRDFDLGIKGPGLGRSPMPAGRRSPLTKTFRHGVQRRQTQVERYQRAMAKRYPGGRQ